jgi:hypothetical protein
MIPPGQNGAALYIIIRNWQRFQHYKDRSPPWIKNHVQLLHNHDYLDLPGDCRAILHGLWLEYASSHARLPLDTRSLSRRLGLRVTRQQLDRLNHAGFLEYSLAPCEHDASATRAGGETEAEAQEQEQEHLPKPMPVAKQVAQALAIEHKAGDPEP